MKRKPANLALAVVIFALSAAPNRAASLYTAEQASSGQEKYEHFCRSCHGDNLDDGDMGGAPLTGSWFRSHWGGGDVGALYAFMKGQMPPDNPGGLNDESYADLVAYILSRNGYAAGSDALPTDPAAQAKLQLAPPQK